MTITNPNAPAVPVDVLGDDTEPGRPRPWLPKVVALAVALTAAAVVPPKVVQARAQDRRDATAAADGVLLSLLPGRGAGRLGVLVSNDGPAAVRLVDVRVDGPGYRRVPASGRIASRDATDLALVDTRTCGEELLEADGAGTAEVRVRTGAGRLVQRTVAVPVDAWTALLEAAQRRCGYLAPQQALTTTLQLGRHGSRPSLHVTLRNTGRVPLVLAYVALPGLPLFADARRKLPLTVPAGATRALDVVLLSSCDPSGLYTGDGPTGGVLELQVLPALRDGQGVLTSVTVEDLVVARQLTAQTPTCVTTPDVVVAG